jgi:Uma2 family endonuclease
MATRTKAPVILEAGDHLTRDEFHRRYLASPRIKKAELIDGVVYVPSPLRGDYHGEPHGYVMHWLGHYRLQVSGLRCMDNTTLLLDGVVEVQPDAMLWRPEPGGPSLNQDGFVVGAPQLIVEVAATSASYDLHEKKKEAYRRNGVAEYVVWRVLDEAIDWFHLVDGQYLLIEPDAEVIVESEQFPGLRLHIPSMLAGDLAAVLARMSGGPKA